jgi:hypothetical protein
LLCGYSVERVRADYGYDLILFTYDENGEPETGVIYMQAKATDNLSLLADGQTITVRVRRADLELWLRESMPCILVMYDARAETAYWCHVQAHFAGQPGFDLAKAGNRVTVHIPASRILDQDAMRSIARLRDVLIQQSEEGAP